MLSILEFMFEELGLIEEFKINNATLKRWLVSSSVFPSSLQGSIQISIH